MCTYSMVVDQFYDHWNPPTFYPAWTPPSPPPLPTAEEIAEFRELLRKAREHDRLTNQPDCESNEKKERLRKLADQLGFEIEFI